MIGIINNNRRAIFYLLVTLVVAVSGISVFFLPSSAVNTEAGSLPLLAFIPLFAYAILIILPFLYKRHERERFVWGNRFSKGILLGFILITMIFLIELASGLIRIEDVTPDVQSILLSGVILQMIVTLGEELPFRGYILPDLEKRHGSLNAVFYSSIFFSLLHIPSILTLNTSTQNTVIMLFTIMIAEILLAVCYLYDGLFMSMGFHFSWNFFQYHVYSMREGFGGIFKIAFEQQLITGGTLGPEAGLLGMFIVILALIIVLVWMQSR